MRLSLVGVLALATLLAGTFSAQATRWGKEYVPNVPVVTQDGKTLNFYDDLIKDKIVVLNFTSCKDICPLATARLGEAQDKRWHRCRAQRRCGDRQGPRGGRRTCSGFPECPPADRLGTASRGRRGRRRHIVSSALVSINTCLRPSTSTATPRCGATSCNVCSTIEGNLSGLKPKTLPQHPRMAPSACAPATPGAAIAGGREVMTKETRFAERSEQARYPPGLAEVADRACQSLSLARLGGRRRGTGRHGP
jgi:hypothetical protein